MTIKTIINYRSRDIILIHVIWMFLNSNPSNENEAQRVRRSHTPKIFHPMSRITVLALQSVGFEMEES